MRMRQTFQASLIAGAVSALWGYAPGAVAVEPGYTFNSGGTVVRDSNGDCVLTDRWTPDMASMQCHPELVARLTPAQVREEEPMVEAPVAPPTAPPPMRRVTLDTDTTFNFDSSDLTDTGKDTLNEIVDVSQQAENVQVQVTGHADQIGPDDYNLDLSRRRAEAVKDYLVSQGLPEESIRIAARGESEPVVQCEGLAGNTLIECLQPNRRSEVEFAAFETVEEGEAPSDTGESGTSSPRSSGTGGMPNGSSVHPSK